MTLEQPKALVLIVILLLACATTWLLRYCFRLKSHEETANILAAFPIIAGAFAALAPITAVFAPELISTSIRIAAPSYHYYIGYLAISRNYESMIVASFEHPSFGNEKDNLTAVLELPGDVIFRQPRENELTPARKAAGTDGVFVPRASFGPGTCLLVNSVTLVPYQSEAARTKTENGETKLENIEKRLINRFEEIPILKTPKDIQSEKTDITTKLQDHFGYRSPETECIEDLKQTNRTRFCRVAVWAKGQVMTC